MTILPIHPAQNASPGALRAFLAQCHHAAVQDGRAKLVSISLAVDVLDPLAVLESIFEPGEPHFYTERPGIETAIAGAEVAVEFEAKGPDRFAAVQRFIDETLAQTIAVGDVNAPFGGPHFFAGFAFRDEVEAGERFPAARVFVPRWQVAKAGTTTTAVANFLVAPEVDLTALAERVWRAHAKFKGFEYGERRGMGIPPVGLNEENHARDARATVITEEGDYRAVVARALECIETGEFKKIVLARAQVLQANQPLHPLQVLNGLRQRFPDCYSFSFANGGGQSFIGASPERLVRVSKGVLETEALAGSIRRGAGASEDAALAAVLLGSEKDLREQRDVLDDIVMRLTPLGLTLDFPPRPHLRRLANVQHLNTSVRAALPEAVRLLAVLAALHPTPAVGGSPREAALGKMRELEGFPRGLYAGALGWLNARGGGEFFVGIRSALVDGSTARVYAGAGIVAGSTPEKEFAETELKFKAMRDALLTP
ncbi:MAG: isochorismate synthase [Opitutia bacterium]|nr:isochorismate synthase [Opitutaceae bacterium]PHX73543.1 MAG: isochorismate synthase [Opitutae bacterium]